VHRLYAPGAALGALSLSPEQARHVAVLRLEDGAPLELFDGHGRRFRAELSSGALRVLEELEPSPQRHADVVLVQALAKGEKMDVVVQKATELGASRIVPLAAERAVVRLDGERAGARLERWRKVAQEAARQCQRSDVPRVDEPAAWADVYALLQQEPSRRGILLDPAERELRLSAAARGALQLLLAVGPEGGFSDREREDAVRHGMISASLGPLVLRTETAGLAALAIVLHVHGELG
jgi:16S rRNA (uracil1498-N3)-methyltransferase